MARSRLTGLEIGDHKQLREVKRTYFEFDLVLELVQRFGDGLVVFFEDFAGCFLFDLVLLESKQKWQVNSTQVSQAGQVVTWSSFTCKSSSSVS